MCRQIILTGTNGDDPTYRFQYQKILRLSNKEQTCENYLFEDYRLKSGMTIWILALMTSGETVEKPYFCHFSYQTFFIFS